MGERYEGGAWCGDSHPPRKSGIGCLWLCKAKFDSDGQVKKYKTWLVDKGFTQYNSTDYFQAVSHCHDGLFLYFSIASFGSGFLSEATSWICERVCSVWTFASPVYGMRKLIHPFQSVAFTHCKSNHNVYLLEQTLCGICIHGINLIEMDWKLTHWIPGSI